MLSIDILKFSAECDGVVGIELFLVEDAEEGRAGRGVAGRAQV